jgi:hypothetical protein
VSRLTSFGCGGQDVADRYSCCEDQNGTDAEEVNDGQAAGAAGDVAGVYCG